MVELKEIKIFENCLDQWEKNCYKILFKSCLLLFFVVFSPAREA